MPCFSRPYCVSTSVFFIGSPAPLPAALTRTLRLKGIDYSHWSATPVYAVELVEGLEAIPDSPELNRLGELLGARLLECEPEINDDLDSAWVLPRPGVTSPWASKALDILANTHCDAVSAIAAGMLWRGRGLIAQYCYDPMTQALYHRYPNLADYFTHPPADGLRLIDADQASLGRHAQQEGLGLSSAEITLLVDFYREANRAATDAELMMFAQANSEHCRHKIFKASWLLNGLECNAGLFDLVRATTRSSPARVLSAYSDNAAVMRGKETRRLMPDAAYRYHERREQLHICLKAETHNHPTAIAPYAGAATGVGGEIRDEAATGLGAMPKAGWCGFITANLRLPNLPMPWEKPASPPPHADALAIMLEGPMGGANYGNEFGRPNLMGFFRTLETSLANRCYAYFKPVMLAGGIASIESSRVKKNGFGAGALLVVLGGPALRIGLGGGSASSASQGSNRAEIDFSSVQRDNPEIQRRCQMVIDACCAEAENPIASIHDIGAGGLANAFPELVHDCGLGARIRLEAVPSGDASMSPMEIWCSEAQERYALAIMPTMLERFAAFCARERCPYAVIGEATEEEQLVVTQGKTKVVDMPMSVLFGSLPRLVMQANSSKAADSAHAAPDLPLATALVRVLACPSVASKEFLVIIADRSITGMVAGEAMVGPWQTPVGDCGLTLDSPVETGGQAFALGERSPVAIGNPAAASRLAIAEALTNLAACGEAAPDKVILSANWMAAPGTPGNNAELRQAVEAASEFCRELGIAIPVGKDSLSMRSRFGRGKQRVEAEAPVTLVASALTQVQDVRNRLTPQLLEKGEIWLIEPVRQDYVLGASALAQVCDSFGGATPDVSSVEVRQLLALLRDGRRLFSAYHDRSDGGLWACLCEMAFAARLGLVIHCQHVDPLPFLLHEGTGACVQLLPKMETGFAKLAAEYPALRVEKIATVQSEACIDLRLAGEKNLNFGLASLLHQWQAVSESISLLRDAPEAVRSAMAHNRNLKTRMVEKADYPLLAAPAVNSTKPVVAVLREQGSNGHRDLAYAFHAAGFAVIDLATQDLRDGFDLTSVQGLAVCGGFSYGDVLGGGTGWARGIAQHPGTREALHAFWRRPDTFTLGICNGCQMLAQLGDCIPGAEHFAPLLANQSGRFEGRLVQVRITKSPSVLLADMQEAQLVTPIAHGYGQFPALAEQYENLISAVYCDYTGETATAYPANPNGSPQSTAGLCNADGRVTLLMPHPERRYLTRQCPWRHPLATPWHDEYSPWFRMFQNARAFVA